MNKMIHSSYKIKRGDTANIPLMVDIPIGSVVRVHLRQYADSDTFYALELVTLSSEDGLISDTVIVIPSEISASLNGHYELDVEITDSNSVVTTVQHSDINVIPDITRTTGTAGETLPSDLERNKLIATEFWLRMPNNEIVKVNLSTATIGEVTAGSTTFTATATVLSTNVQSAIEELDSKKVTSQYVATEIDSLTCTSLSLVTPNDSANLTKEGFLYILGTAGNVRFLSSNNEDLTLNLDKKEILPLYVKKVFATGTTALGIYLLSN